MLETWICGDTQIPASSLRLALDRLGKIDKKFLNITDFEKQFQVTLKRLFNGLYMCIILLCDKVLDQVSPKPLEVCCDSAMKYSDKNRDTNFLPRELLDMYSFW